MRCGFAHTNTGREAVNLDTLVSDVSSTTVSVGWHVKKKLCKGILNQRMPAEISPK